MNGSSEWVFKNYLISTDKSLLSIDAIKGLLEKSYWASQRPISVIETSIANSICIGIYHQEVQVGFARVVTDYATMFWIADVFIHEKHRGNGLGKELVKYILDIPAVKGLRGVLMTKDAHGLYKQFGFEMIPEYAMVRFPLT